MIKGIKMEKESKAIQVIFYGQEEIKLLKETQKHCIDLDISFNNLVKNLIKKEMGIESALDSLVEAIIPENESIKPDQFYTQEDLSKILLKDKANISRMFKKAGIEGKTEGRTKLYTGKEALQALKK